MTLQIKQKEILIEHSKNYLDSSHPFGIDIATFLRDVINNPLNYMKDRLKATKLLMDYTSSKKEKHVLVLDTLEKTSYKKNTLLNPL